MTTPFVSGNQPIYCSYTERHQLRRNWTHRPTPTSTADGRGLFRTQPVPGDQDYNKADAILWQNTVTLPLYQTPQFFDWSNNLKGVLPNTSSVGVTWNAENWSLSG